MVKKLNFLAIALSICLSGIAFSDSYNQSIKPNFPKDNKESSDKHSSNSLFYFKGGFKGTSLGGTIDVALGYRLLDTFGFDANIGLVYDAVEISFVPLYSFLEMETYKLYTGLGLGAHDRIFLRGYTTIDSVLGIQYNHPTSYFPKFIQLEASRSIGENYGKAYYSVGLFSGFSF